MLELFQLKCFTAVAEELHFGRAAARLFITQPPLSRQIQLLEENIGVKLLERTSRSVCLTTPGKTFYQDALSILRLAEQAVAGARRTASGESGRVTIGYTAVSGYDLIPNLVNAFQRILPDIDIVLREMVSADQIEALGSHAMDLAFVRPLNTEHAFQYHLVVREPMMLAVPARHPLAAKPKIRLKELQQQALVMYCPSESRYFYDKVMDLFVASGVTPRYVQHLAQTHTILSLVRAGIGMAVVPSSVMHLPFKNIVYKPLWRHDIFAEIYLAWDPNNRNPALNLVREFAVKHLTGSP